MTIPKVVVGVWCGEDKGLFSEVNGIPVLRITLARAAASGFLTVALIPWDRDHEHIAYTVKTWRTVYPVRRCHPADLVAMRDLVIEQGADVGVRVNKGTCAVVDAAEIKLAAARREYRSPRLYAAPAEEWLRVTDTDEWQEPIEDNAALRAFFEGEDPLTASARQIKVWRALGYKFIPKG